MVELSSAVVFSPIVLKPILKNSFFSGILEQVIENL